MTGGGEYRDIENRLKSIMLPSTVEIMGNFYGCTTLSELYCKSITPPVACSGFLDYYYDGISTQPHRPIKCTIYVPKESVELYKTAKYWSDYKDQIVGYYFD